MLAVDKHALKYTPRYFSTKMHNTNYVDLIAVFIAMTVFFFFNSRCFAFKTAIIRCFSYKSKHVD